MQLNTLPVQLHHGSKMQPNSAGLLQFMVHGDYSFGCHCWGYFTILHCILWFSWIHNGVKHIWNKHPLSVSGLTNNSDGKSLRKVDLVQWYFLIDFCGSFCYIYSVSSVYFMLFPLDIICNLPFRLDKVGLFALKHFKCYKTLYKKL